MIGCVQGKLLNKEMDKILLLTNSGLGHEVFFNGSHELKIEEDYLIFTSNIIKETSNDLYGFLSIQEKKIFELLISVKGVGPKSAFSMVNTLGPGEIINAIIFDNKKVLSTAPGIGKKAASQIILDLSDKISKLGLDSLSMRPQGSLGLEEVPDSNALQAANKVGTETYLQETIMACKELGFKESDISNLAREILNRSEISSSEQLIHQVLKEL